MPAGLRSEGFPSASPVGLPPAPALPLGGGGLTNPVPSVHLGSLGPTTSLLSPLLFNVDVKATKRVACFYAEVTGHEESPFLYFI